MGHGIMTGSNTPGAQGPANMARVFAAPLNRCSVGPRSVQCSSMDMDTDADADMTSHKGQRGRGGLLCVKLREGPRSVQCSSMDMDTDADLSLIHI